MPLRAAIMAIVSGVLLALPFWVLLGDAYGERPRGPGNLSFRGGLLAAFLLGWFLVPHFRRAGPLRSLPTFLVAGVVVGGTMHFLLSVTAESGALADPGPLLESGWGLWVALGSGAVAFLGGWGYLRLFDDGEGDGW